MRLAKLSLGGVRPETGHVEAATSNKAKNTPLHRLHPNQSMDVQYLYFHEIASLKSA